MKDEVKDEFRGPRLERREVRESIGSYRYREVELELKGLPLVLCFVSFPSTGLSLSVGNPINQYLSSQVAKPLSFLAPPFRPVSKPLSPVE